MVELGAGRGEMAEAFSEWNYVPVDLDAGDLPEHFAGVVFSNEFFDALPVDARRVPGWRVPRAARRLADGRFRLGTPARRLAPRCRAIPARYYLPPRRGSWYEVNLEALAWMERIARQR